MRADRGLVFLTRKFPPSVGGMETLAASVWESLQTGVPQVRKISQGGSNRNLVWWVPLALLRLAWWCATGRVSSVLCGDALMNSLSAPLLRVFNVPRSTMIMGLDVTYESAFYRRLVHLRLRTAEHVIAISEATAEAARRVGVAEQRLSVLRLGVPAPTFVPDRRAARASLGAWLGLPSDAFVLLTLGRLVPRKGVRWFVSNVLPALPGDVHYVVAGTGPDEAAIRTAAQHAGVAERVYLIGHVSDEQREELMSGADVFVQPNIAVPGDMEGFGLVTVEAGMRGTPVVAAALEGIKDAVIPDVTGILVESADADGWVNVLDGLHRDRSSLPTIGDRFGAATRTTYSEKSMGAALAELLGTRGQV